MVIHSVPQPDQPVERSAREWVKILAQYREPTTARSAFELAVTVVPFVALWALAWWSMSISLWLTLAISMLNALFLVRLFTIQHDCGHGAFFQSREVSDWLGRALGVLTLTPYDVWRRTHAIHHSAAGNLDKRGIGDVYTMTVAEYQAAHPLRRLQYRLVRHPLTMFGLGPFYLFFLQNRVPLGLMDSRKYWLSAMATNLVLVGVLGGIYYFGGLAPLLLIFLPTTLIAATAGVWLFYVQHQFENTQYDQHEEWDLHEAALKGSSYYRLPAVLQWFSANIGIHHVHHLYSRIPFYRLPEVLKEHGELAENNQMSVRESLASARLHLWDEKTRRLLSFREVKAIYG
ncbi:MAG: fatty acid desaturase [Rhodobacteraceae bacterium]|nr:fatty acid desaturase [Paracoccaceae bacterium]